MCDFQYHPSGFAFSTGSEDKTARMFDIRSDQQVALYKAPSGTPGFTSCGLSKSGRYVLCGSDDTTIHIWDTMKNQHNGMQFTLKFVWI
jgi:guanine nucleotide-binding protein subunit beta, other